MVRSPPVTRETGVRFLAGERGYFFLRHFLHERFSLLLTYIVVFLFVCKNKKMPSLQFSKIPTGLYDKGAMGNRETDVLRNSAVRNTTSQITTKCVKKRNQQITYLCRNRPLQTFTFEWQTPSTSSHNRTLFCRKVSWDTQSIVVFDLAWLQLLHRQFTVRWEYLGITGEFWNEDIVKDRLLGM